MVAGQTDTQAARSRARVVAALGLGTATLVAALLLDWPALLVPAALALVTLAVIDRRQFSALFNKWLWLGLALVVVLPVWLLGARGEGDTPHPGGNVRALAIGISMAIRVLTTLAVMLSIGGCIAPAAVSRFLGRFVGKDLGLACAIGINLLPAVLEILRRTTLALRLRGGFKRHRWANLKRFATAIGVQTVRLTEDVAEALLLAQATGRKSALSDTSDESGESAQ
jgi:hypothetical protein